MKTLRQIIESAISSVSGGLFVDDRNISTEQIEQKVHEGRSLWCDQQYMKTKRVHPDWIQRFYPEYDSELQTDKCRTVFNMPHVMLFSDKSDGLQYFGSDSYADNFTRIPSRAALATMMNHPVMKVGRRNYVLYQNGQGECYTKTNINAPIVEGVFARPTDVPTFNKEKDAYPCDSQGVDFIEKYLSQTVLKMEISTPADKNSDGVDSTKLPRATK
jgi:hypothetical protein